MNARTATKVARLPPSCSGARKRATNGMLWRRRRTRCPGQSRWARDVSFAIFKEPALRRLVRDFARSDALVALVGAGASVESQLPSWEELVEAALLRAAADASLPLSEEEVGIWAAETIRRESLLGAMATAKALIKEPVTKWLPDLLYKELGAAAYQPGPISRQVAYLSVVFDRNLAIATTNYDDLLEIALERRSEIKVPVFPYTGPKSRRPPSGPHIKVTHPHGFYGRTRHQGDTILTLEQYHHLQRGSSWQESYIGEKMMEGDCLFIGMSMTDSNILRYLDYYSARSRHHAALIVRQGERSSNPQIQSSHETATAARWRAKGVKATFLDHFADVAYVLHEIAYCREVGVDSYRSLDDRCEHWIKAVERRIIAPHSPSRFRDGQNAMNEVLRGTLGAALEAVAEGGVDIKDDKLAMSLWLLSSDGTRLTCWSSTDRLQYDPDTIVPISLDAESKWIAVSAMCHGKQVVGKPTASTSRWGYIVGLPLQVSLDGDGTLPIGCLTVTSMRSQSESILTSMPPDVQAKFNSTVRKAIAAFLIEGSRR
jgi:NAD-dependent SIR2 family protein deacetylase